MLKFTQLNKIIITYLFVNYNMTSNKNLNSTIRNIFKNPKGDPLHGDCITYATALTEYYNGQGVFCVYVPSHDEYRSIHAAAVINNNYYDVRGKITKNDLIGEQMMVMRRQHKKYITDNGINESLVQHLKSESEIITSEEAREFNIFKEDLYNEILNKLKSN